VSDVSGPEAVDHRHVVAEYIRLERREVPPPPGTDGPSAISGRAPVDAHLRNAAGGLRTGALLTGLDSLGGLLCGLAVQPEWIVTTSMMATVAHLAHTGPLGLLGRIVRRGRTSVVATLDVVDEGRDHRPVASATVTCAVLDPGDMELHFDRPLVIPMGPPTADPPGPEEFFAIAPGTGPVTRLDLVDRLRNPWGILHGGAVAVLADVAACRAVVATGGRDRPPVAAADTVLHYLRPARVGPVEARCTVLGDGGVGDGVLGDGVLGGRRGRPLVRVAVHDVGAGERLVALGSVVVADV
jgi:acyl-coenzyme A thioesterase PaaI-like protein